MRVWKQIRNHVRRRDLGEILSDLGDLFKGRVCKEIRVWKLSVLLFMSDI
jgi:hypothetical protein